MDRRGGRRRGKAVGEEEREAVGEDVGAAEGREDEDVADFDGL